MEPKRIGDVVPQNVSGMQTEISSTSETSRERFRETYQRLLPVWQTMAEMYGHKWTSGFGESVSVTWVASCGDLTTDELKRGMKACIPRSAEKKRLGEEDWPPVAGEFRAMCRPASYLYQSQVPLLPPPKLTDEQKAQRHEDILGLKRMLRESIHEQEEARKLRLRELWQKTKIPLSDMLAEREPGSDDDAGADGTEDK